MKVEELRIGNLIDWDRHVFPIAQINSGGFYHVRAFANIISGHINDGKITPIPLTEEWILNLGMKEDYPNARSFTKDSIQIKYDFVKTGITVCIDAHSENFGFGKHETDIEIQFVHQLQNLYFSLTGKELEMIN